MWLWWGCAARLSLTRWCLLRASTCDLARTSAPRILCSDVSSLARRTLTCGILEAFKRIGRPRATH